VNVSFLSVHLINILDGFLLNNRNKGLIIDWKNHIFFQDGLMSYLRVLYLDNRQITSGIENSLKLINARKPVSVENEKSVVKLLINHLNNTLKAYPTTFQEDNELLDELYELDDPKLTNKKNAVILRFAEKKLINTHIEALVNYSNNLQKQSANNPDENLYGGYRKNPNWARLEF